MSFQLHPDTTIDVVHLYVSNVKKSLEFLYGSTKYEGAKRRRSSRYIWE